MACVDSLLATLTLPVYKLNRPINIKAELEMILNPSSHLLHSSSSRLRLRSARRVYCNGDHQVDEGGWNSKAYASRRRPITRDEICKATADAHKFQTQTKHPSVVVTIRPSSVYRGFWLVTNSGRTQILLQVLIMFSERWADFWAN